MVMEIIIIVIIIAVIFLFMSGGMPIPMGRTYGPVMPLAKHQWQCEEVVWSTAAIVRDQFNGAMELRCEVEGLTGEGIIGLRKHMVAVLPKSAEKIHSGPEVESFESLPSVRYDLTLRMNAENESALVRGDAHIATDGFTRLRNVFVGREMPTNGAARYIRSVNSEVSVEPTDRPGWFRVRILNANLVARPWYISAPKFRQAMVDRSEEEFTTRAESILTDLANHL